MLLACIERRKQECCTANTCGDPDGGLDGRSTKVPCGASFVAKPAATKCTTCQADGAECCTPKTCGRPNGDGSTAVPCGAGFIPKAAATKCATCEADGAQCCTAKTCGNPDGRGTKVQCGAGYVAKAATTKCTTCTYNKCCTRERTCGTKEVFCSRAFVYKDASTKCTPDGDECCAAKKEGTLYPAPQSAHAIVVTQRTLRVQRQLSVPTLAVLPACCCCVALGR